MGLDALARSDFWVLSPDGHSMRPRQARPRERRPTPQPARSRRRSSASRPSLDSDYVLDPHFEVPLFRASEACLQ